MPPSIHRIDNAPQLADGTVMPYSRATVAGGFVFVSGQLAFGEDGRIVDGGIQAQTRQALRNLQAVLTKAGCAADDVVKVTAWLSDMADFPAFNAVYREFFGGEFPARSTTGGAQLAFGAVVEIEAQD